MKKIALLATGFLCLLLLMKCGPDRGSKDKTVDYTLVSDLVLQALLRANEPMQSEDTSKIVKVSFRGNERMVGAARPEDLQRIVYLNDAVRSQTNTIVSLAGDRGTCCCPCDVAEGEVTLYSNHCPCPKFYQLNFIAPDTAQAEMYFDQEKFNEKEWDAARGWVLFSVSEKTVTEGDHSIRISGDFFGTATREEFVINITVIDGKAYLR